MFGVPLQGAAQHWPGLFMNNDQCTADLKTFHTELTEARHRGHGEVVVIFSVHSVVNDLAHAGGEGSP